MKARKPAIAAANANASRLGSDRGRGGRARQRRGPPTPARSSSARPPSRAASRRGRTRSHGPFDGRRWRCTSPSRSAAASSEPPRLSTCSERAACARKLSTNPCGASCEERNDAERRDGGEGREPAQRERSASRPPGEDQRRRNEDDGIDLRRERGAEQRECRRASAGERTAPARRRSEARARRRRC